MLMNNSGKSMQMIVGGRLMATLKDVAKLANVDVSTVSRALNNTSYVHPDTKKKYSRR